MKPMHYRRHYNQGHATQSAYDLLSTVLLEGLRGVARRDELETYGELFAEFDWLLAENGIKSEYCYKTGQRTITLINK